MAELRLEHLASCPRAKKNSGISGLMVGNLKESGCVCTVRLRPRRMSGDPESRILVVSASLDQARVAVKRMFCDASYMIFI
jgi:hypothetical protein